MRRNHPQGEDPRPVDAVQIYLPNDGELMAARGAIIGYVDSIANGNLRPTTEVLNTLIEAVVVSLRWSPQQKGAG